MKKVLRKNIKRVVAGGLIASTLVASSFGNVTAHAETLYTQGLVSTQAVADQNGFVIENGELTKYEGSATQVTIPDSVSVIGSESFSGCTNIKSVTIPSTVTEIRYSAFSGCTNLESINIPSSVEKIFDCAFENCSSLKSITIPYAKAFIGNGAFHGCSNLVSISLPASIGSIGNHTFMGCSSLTSISLPDTIKFICGSAFDGCSSLKSINIPNQITEIDGATFYGCSSLTSITIPNTVTRIGSYAFYGCRNLSRISIPSSVTSIEQNAFGGCSNLVVDTPNYSYAYQYCIENGYLLAGVITPTPKPTSTPTAAPTSTPTVRPTSTPTVRPTSTPTARPTSTPTARPTSTPTARPTSTPTARPTSTPTAKPTSTPTAKPTSKPTSTPTAKPTSKPTSTPTAKPTNPTAKPTSTPTAKPTSTPTATPTQAPKTCTVTFDAQGGVVGTDVKQVTNGEKYGMLPTSVKQGYNFVGWYTDPSYGTKVTEDTIVSETENHTLYAHWMRTYESIGLESLSYQFSNMRSSFQYGEEYKIPLDVYEAIFGKTIKAYRLFENSSKWGGNCFGMVATSILFNVLSNDVDITDYNGEATCVADCLPEQKEKDTGISLTKFIEMMHVAQKDSLVQQSIIENQNDLNGLCQAVTDTMEQKGDPIIIALYGPEGGHAVVGYKLTGNKLYIYDPNMPSVSRYITLEKNTNGDYVSWEYLMNDAYSWGAGKDKCWISYVPYKAYYEVWSKRGSASESEKNLMHLNLDNAQIYDSNDTLVAEYCNGKLQNNTDQVFEQVKMDLGEQDDNGTHSIYLPAGTYTVKNTDGKQKEFTVSMVNVNLGATVKTSAEQVEISVEDAQNKNDVNIDAKKGQNYEISLDSSFEYDNQNVTLEGTGQGDTINVSQSKGNVKFYGVDSKLYINGEEVEYATIKAFANPGGTISKEGIIGVTKGESQTFIIQPDEGYEIADVLVDGKSRGAVSSYTFENVQENHSIIASFKEKKAASSESVIKKGLLVTVGDLQYKVTKVSDTNGTVALVKSKKTTRTSVVIPDKVSIGGKKYKVTAVSDNVFANHKKLKSVTIGKNVTTIGKKVFYGDSNLKTITIKSQALKTVGAKAFSGTYKKAVVKVAKAKFSTYKKLLAKKGLNKMVVYKKF